MIRQCVKIKDRFQDDIVKEDKFTRQNDSPSNIVTNAKHFNSSLKMYHCVPRTHFTATVLGLL